MIEDRDKVRGIGRQLHRLACDELVDPEDLRETFAVIRRELDEAERLAVRSMRLRGSSWAQIGAGAGMTRQSAQEKWGRSVVTA